MKETASEPAGATGSPALSASVVIPTYNRPDYLRTCLEHVGAQTVTPVDVVVVDSSPGPETQRVVEDFPGVRYLRNPKGAGSTATSRALGVAASSGSVVAFLDDDAYAQPDWLEQLMARYVDGRVAGVGGRAVNGQPGEEREGVGEIGRFLPNGSLTGYFAADPGCDVDVDHLLGANMSFRRSAVDEVGGIQDHYPGTCLREETDIALRLRLRGYRLVYAPDAVVRHVAGTYAKGRRFDLRYTYYGNRNHVVLLARTVGLRDPRFRRHLGVALGQAGGQVGYAARALRRFSTGNGSVVRGVGNGLLRSVATLAGTAAGLAAAGRLEMARGPARTSAS